MQPTHNEHLPAEDAAGREIEEQLAEGHLTTEEAEIAFHNIYAACN